MTKDGRPDQGAENPENARGMRSPVLVPGTLIGGKFRIQNRIARGGQASVYLAHQEPLNRPVALKILSPPSHEATHEEREAFEQRFLLEARTLASLDHPNIVTIFDYGETDDGRYYLAMEYISGGRFLDLLKSGPLETSRAVYLVMQVAQALRYSHKRGVVHRDVKNSNVLVRQLDSGEEQAKVVDFGLVKLSRMDSSITQTGMILGSPHFMAPEQATGQGVDHRADIYATGVLLYCGLTGKYPFDGPHATAIITSHVTRDVPTFASLVPDLVVPDGLESIVRHCLEKKPSRRYPSMDALIADLAPYHLGTASEGLSGEFHTLTAGHMVVPKRDWTTVAAAVIAGGIIAALLGMLLLTLFVGWTMQEKEVERMTPTVEAPQSPPPVQIAQPAVPEVEPPPAKRKVAPTPKPEVVSPAPKRVKAAPVPKAKAPAPVEEIRTEPPPARKPPAVKKADSWDDVRPLDETPDPWATD
ncbi:MAG: hypothetical protein CL930_06500 [Deltaproteobacteria bacterium]|nr:hypothetical protein [Deltaproteobacteria bacterium]